MSKSIKARSLELFFVDGTPDGMLTAKIPFQWTGHVLVAARTQLVDALKREEARHPGIYLLVGEDETGAMLYIGESDDIGNRIRNHDANKEWWSTAVFITSTGEPLNKAHARYLESRLIGEARRIGKSKLDNGTAPPAPPLSEAAIAHMDDFLENILLILPALRFDFLTENSVPEKPTTQSHQKAEPTIFVLATPRRGIEATARLEDGRFIVEAGAKATMNWVGTTSEDTSYAKLFQELAEKEILRVDNAHRVLIRDYVFSSTSGAAAVLNGRPTSGPISWKLKGTDKTYKEWERESLQASAQAHTDVDA